jgi:hypothetical protein
VLPSLIYFVVVRILVDGDTMWAQEADEKVAEKNYEHPGSLLCEQKWVTIILQWMRSMKKEWLWCDRWNLMYN